MIYLNFSTIEKLIFYDKDAQKFLPPHMFGLFEQWRLAKRLPMLKDLGKTALLDVLNSISDDDVNLLEQYFGERIFLEKLNYSLVRDIKISLTDNKICEILCEVEGFNYFTTWRCKDYLHITYWR